MASKPKGALSGTARLYGLYDRIRSILETARAGVARTVNTTQVAANWLIGREIVEEEQKGKERAGYGERLLQAMAEKLHADFGAGYSYANLKLMRQFYLSFPALLGEVARIGYASRSQSGHAKKGDAVRSQSASTPPDAAPVTSAAWQARTTTSEPLLDTLPDADA